MQGQPVKELFLAIPASYRRCGIGSPERFAGKSDFEKHFLDTLLDLKADIVALDDMLIILMNWCGQAVCLRAILSISTPTLRAWNRPMNGARGIKVVNWQTMENRTRRANLHDCGFIPLCR